MTGGLAQVKDIGFYLTTKFGGKAEALAAGTGDATEKDGATITLASVGYPKSAKCVLAYETVLAQAATLTLAYNLQWYNGSSWTDVTDPAAVSATTVATGGTGGSTESGTVEIDVDFTKLQDATAYRVQYTPNLSAANTDTADITAVWVLGGFDELPV